VSNDNRYKINVILGCFGRTEDGFVSCRGCENSILEVTPSIDHFNDMMDYFESCRLFDRPMFEMTPIRHFIFNMQDRFDQLSIGRKLWSEKKFNLYQKFILDHRFCGLYIKLVLNKDLNQDQNEIEENKDIKIFISSEDDIKTPKKQKTNLTLVRGRR
jgi:hypothetical protein